MERSIAACNTQRQHLNPRNRTSPSADTHATGYEPIAAAPSVLPWQVLAPIKTKLTRLWAQKKPPLQGMAFFVWNFFTWHRAIFSGGYPPNIVAAAAFHNRVRDGSEWFHSAMDTRIENSQGLNPENCIAASSRLSSRSCKSGLNKVIQGKNQMLVKPSVY